MNYIEVCFEPVDENLSELLLAELTSAGAESFWQDDDRLHAYFSLATKTNGLQLCSKKNDPLSNLNFMLLIEKFILKNCRKKKNIYLCDPKQ